MPPPVYVYRGVHGRHPALSAARNRIVYAAKPDARLTPGIHYSGTYSGESQFTSWTYDLEVAMRFARRFATDPGVVLRLPKLEPDTLDQRLWFRSAGEDVDKWMWFRGAVEQSDESEVLLRGRRMDAEVVYDGSNE